MGWIISKALYEKWHCSQEQAEASSEGICSDGKQSVLSNGSHIQLAYLSQDKMTEFSRLSRFGMMFKPLTESRGEDLLTWFLGDFLVKTYQAQERVRESKEADQECGNTWHELSMKYDRDLHSWRIHRSLFPEDLSPSLVTLPKWGMMRDGALFQHLTAERPISGTESGCWPTPTANELRQQSPAQAFRHSPSLAFTVKAWPTPGANDNRDRGNLGSPAIQRRAQKGKQIMLSMSVSDTSGALNPPWVEWLMGWPLGWTDLKPLEMDKFQSAWLKHFK